MIEKAPDKASMRAYEFLHDPEVERAVKDVNNKYLYWDKVKYVTKPDKITYEELWTLVKVARNLNYSLIDVKDIPVNFKLYITDYMNQALHNLDMYIGGYLGVSEFISNTEKPKYLLNSLMEEAIASSQMEGASTTRRQAKEMLRKEMKPRNRSEQMIVNNYNTIRYITENKNELLTPATLLNIHWLIARDTLDNPVDEGKFRDSDDIHIVNHLTSEAVYTPPESKRLPVWISNLCDIFNTDSQTFIHPIIKGIIIHFLVGYIHPFYDGNGRTARALFYWYMLKKGYWLTEYLSISRIIYKTKAQYERAFIYTENDGNDLSYFVQYNLEVISRAWESFKEYIQEKRIEQRQTAEYIRLTSVNERQAEVLKLLNDNPQSVLTIKEVENRFGVSYQTARTDVLGLVDMGFLSIIPVNKKKSNYIRSDDFENILREQKISKFKNDTVTL